MRICFAALLAITCATSASAATDDEQDGPEGEAQDVDVAAWSHDDTARALDDAQATLDAAAQEPDTFRPAFLRKLARRYARSVGGLDQGVRPVATKLLRDVDGAPAAFVATFPKPGVDAVPATIADTLTRQGARAARALREGRREDAQRIMRRMLNRDDFMTVIVGASPRAQALVSATQGLGPQALQRIGRALVREAVPGNVTHVAPLRTFFEPRMPRGEHLGILYAVTRGGSARLSLDKRQSPVQGAAVEYVWLLPSPAHRFGEVMTRRAYEQRKKALREQTEAMLAVDGTTTYAGLEGLRGEEWGATAATTGTSGASAICSACTADMTSAIGDGIAKTLGTATIVPDDEPGCAGECRYTYSDGSTEIVSSCDAFAADCCDSGATTDDRCLETCVCDDCVGTRTQTTSIGELIRGVPSYYQVDILDEHTCLEEVPVGCGPIAGLTILSWWDQLGYTALGDPYRVDGRLDWQSMALDLRDDYMFSTCDVGGDASTTDDLLFFLGLRQYVKDRGYGLGVFGDVRTKPVFATEDNEDEMAELIAGELHAQRPVIMAYCTNCEDGLGVDQTHVAVVTGLYRDGGRTFIYVDTGWGAGNDEVYEWNVGDGGKVTLFTFKFRSDPESSTWCIADDRAATLQRQHGVGYSGMFFDTGPVIETISGDVCDLVDIQRTTTTTYTYDERKTCLSPTEIDRLNRVIEENATEIDGLPCWQKPDGSCA